MMKKQLFFALLLLLALPTMAQMRSHHGGYHGQGTTLTITSTDRQGFWLFVDDVLQNEHPVRSICVRNFWAEDFHVRVEIDNRLHNCVGQYVDMSHSQSLNIAQYDGLFGLDFTQAHIRPELTMDLIVATPQVVVPVEPPMPPAPPMPVDPCMNEHDFNGLLSVITEDSFDSGKLNIAKQAIAANPMCVRQIATICKKFDHESNKLEFAKYAYPYCTEKNKYYMLNEVFDFESSKTELSEFIRGL